MPVAWGSVVSFLLQYVSSDLSGPIADALNSEATTLAVTAVVITAWYWLWRKVEPKLPDWATRLVLGSAKSPSYSE